MGITIRDIKSPITGIVHVGAGTITEAEEYYQTFQGIVYWFEPILESFLIGEQNIAKYPNFKQFNIALSDTNETCDFHITSNSGSSSSLLPLKLHLKHHPSAIVTEVRKVQCRRFDDFMVEQGIDTPGLNVLIIDTQGSELRVLKGMQEQLKHTDELIVEVNLVEMYENNPSPQEIVDYLATYSFEVINTQRISQGQAEYQFKRK